LLNDRLLFQASPVAGE